MSKQRSTKSTCGECHHYWRMVYQKTGLPAGCGRCMVDLEHMGRVRSAGKRACAAFEPRGD